MSRRFRHCAEIVEAFYLNPAGPTPTPDWACVALRHGQMISVPGGMRVRSWMGEVFAKLGDWVIRKPSGDLDVCSAERFVVAYEEI